MNAVILPFDKPHEPTQRVRINYLMLYRGPLVRGSSSDLSVDFDSPVESEVEDMSDVESERETRRHANSRRVESPGYYSTDEDSLYQQSTDEHSDVDVPMRRTSTTYDNTSMRAQKGSMRPRARSPVEAFGRSSRDGRTKKGASGVSLQEKPVKRAERVPDRRRQITPPPRNERMHQRYSLRSRPRKKRDSEFEYSD